MASSATKLTYHDYLLLPDDGKRYEILDGELHMTPAPMTRHQLIAGNIYYILRDYLEAHPIGTVFVAPCDVVLGETDVAQPDLLFVHKDGAARITEKNVQGPPDLVIEILSPGTAARDRELKRKRYEHFGVREYWLVDPDFNTIEILGFKDGQFHRISFATRPSSVTSSLFPGLPLDLAWLLK